MKEKMVKAGLQLGISSFENPLQKEYHANHFIQGLTQFQEKLLQRVSPTDPGMRK